MNFYKILICALLVIVDCKGRDFFLSFSVTNINFKNINYQINISKALTENNEKGKFIFKIECNDQNIEICCKRKSNQIFNELLKRNIILTSFSKKTSNSFYEKTKIVYLPKRFDIIIKNNEAYFYLKEDD